MSSAIFLSYKRKRLEWENDEFEMWKLHYNESQLLSSLPATHIENSFVKKAEDITNG
jgi:hypothetical protein